jgi:hypothetical protein
MALRSITFKNDPALQKCLQLDSAHVTPGAAGLHVARIQGALMLLDHARISAADLRSKRYGPTTAAAVLAYKQKRKIINTSYQKTADNIVGKMTIARLDNDLLATERRGTSRVLCESSGVAAAGSHSHGSQSFAETGVQTVSAQSGSAATAGVGKTHFKKFNRQFRLVYQSTSLAEAFGSGLDKLPALIRRASFLMQPHGFSFADEAPATGPIIPHDLLVDVHFNSEAFTILQKSKAMMPGLQDTLRVIFCPFALKNPYFGSTHGGQPVDGFPAVPKFVLIDGRKAHADQGTLLQEMIHASIPGDSLPHDGLARSVYSEADSGRDLLTEERAAQLADAYFA